MTRHSDDWRRRHGEGDRQTDRQTAISWHLGRSERREIDAAGGDRGDIIISSPSRRAERNYILQQQ